MNEPRATDALANERTFLAYIRTALAFIAFGFVIARFSLVLRGIAAATRTHLGVSTLSTTFGITMAVLGIAVGAFGTYRYIASARALRKGTVSILPDSAAIVSGVAIGAIGAIVTWTLLASRP